MSKKYVVDAGNTAIAYGIYDGGVINPQRIATSEISHSSELLSLLNPIGVEDVVVASVGVERIGEIIKQAQAEAGFQLHFVTGIDPLGAVLDYGTPETLGPDRIANTIAVVAQQCVPSIVIDVGTAITIDVVNSDGHFVGGLIAPGLETSRNALTHFAPTLPDVALQAPENLLGTDTTSCIQSGVVHGSAAMINQVVHQLRTQYSIDNVVLTGGHATILYPLVDKSVVCDEWLTLRGLGHADLTKA